MKILFTGGGSGGHFYPIIAVAQAVRDIVREDKLLEPKFYFAAPDPYNEKDLFDLDIEYIQIAAGKVRRYKSILNFFDVFKTAWGIFKAFWMLLFILPDVVFGKGGHGSFPVLVAAKLLGIPVIIHESDSRVGRANLWASKFAKKVAISFPDAKEYLKIENEKIALTGNPIRREIQTVAREGGREYLGLDADVPVLFIIGGSQGAQAINEAVLDALPELLDTYYVIHQTGGTNIGTVKAHAEVVIGNHPHEKRYKPYGYLDLLAIRMAAGVSDLVISRAGAGSIFEIAAWGKPSIMIPIPQDVSHDQHHNAFAYARSGAAIVIEQENLSPNILVSEIGRIMRDGDMQEKMKAGAASFARIDAARILAREILDLALEHEA